MREVFNILISTAVTLVFIYFTAIWIRDVLEPLFAGTYFGYITGALVIVGTPYVWFLTSKKVDHLWP